MINMTIKIISTKKTMKSIIDNEIDDNSHDNYSNYIL